jgi:signal transduction histidine kinase
MNDDNAPAPEGRQRLMLVDDTPENLGLLNAMLSDQGLVLQSFPSGDLAWRAAQRQAPDLVLLDISMPGMDGYEVCARFQADPVLKDVPIIFLTAMTDIGAKIRGFELGAVDYITKPFQMVEVHARIRLHLQLRSLRRRLAMQNADLQQLVDAKVAELARAHQESHQRLAEIAHMNRNLTSAVYSAAIAHDLRQPLAAIHTNVDAARLFMRHEPPQLDQVTQILDDIGRDNLRADQIIQRMRAILNKTRAETVQVDLNEIGRETVVFLAGEARLRGMRLRFAAAPSTLPVRGDRVQLQQILINLVLNGLDAMAGAPDGAREVVVTAARIDENAQWSVADAGTGFLEIDRAFESFFSTKPQGMGVGLSITAGLVHAHGGAIEAQNNAGPGATVRVTLPLDQGPPDGQEG